MPFKLITPGFCYWISSIQDICRLQNWIH